MKTRMYLAVAAVVGLMACSGTSFAHDMDGRYGTGSGVMTHHGMGCDNCLSPEKKEMVHQAMHSTMEKNRPLWNQMRADHEKMHRIISATKFNRKAFLATANDMSRLHERMEHNRALAMASVAGKLSPQERMAAAKMWMAGGPHGFHHDGHEGFHHAPHDMPQTQPMQRYHEDDYRSLN